MILLEVELRHDGQQAQQHLAVSLEQQHFTYRFQIFVCQKIRAATLVISKVINDGFENYRNCSQLGWRTSSII